MSPSTRPVRRSAVIAAEKVSQHYNTKSKRNVHTSLSTTVTTRNNSDEPNSTNTLRNGYKNKRKRQKQDSNQLNRSARHSGLPQPGLSFELWQIILKDLVPSQLAIVAQVSNGMAAIVRGLSIWKTIAGTANLGLPVTRGIRRTYYGVVLMASSRVCENCFTKCKPSGYKAALPVLVQDQHKQVCMCLECRQDYFDKHSELPLPSPRATATKASSSSLTSVEAAEQEEIKDDNDDALEPLDRVILRHYGGRVGVEAERRKQRAMSETRAKNQQARQEERRLELVQRLSGLGVWYDPQSSMTFQRYVMRGKPELEIAIEGLVEEAELHREKEARQQELRTRLEDALEGLLMDNDEDEAQTEKKKKKKSEQQRVNEYMTTLQDCIVYIQYGHPEQLERAVETAVETARRDQERKTRRKELETKLAALKLEVYMSAYECTTYIHSGRPQDMEHIIRVIAEREREKQERIETMAKRRKELMDRLEEEQISHVFDHVEHFVGLLWMEVDTIVENAKREAREEQVKQERRRMLEDRLHANGVELREDSTLCASYINNVTDNLDSVVCRMTELAWYFRETNYGAMRHGIHGRLYYRRVSLEQYIRERLSSLNFGPVSDDLDTLARPPPSLWDQIKRLEPGQWKEHAKTCMVEGLVRAKDATIKEALRQPLGSPFILSAVDFSTIMTQQVLVEAMDQGAIALAKDPSPASSTSTTIRPSTFSSALRGLLGDEVFSFFVESNRLAAVLNARKKLLDEQVSVSATASHSDTNSNMQQPIDSTTNDATIADDSGMNEDVPMADAPLLAVHKYTLQF